MSRSVVPVAGAYGVSWMPALPGSARGDSATSTLAAVARQVNRARLRTPLADVRQAEDREVFTTGAKASAAPAYAHTAYWLAVGSRLLGYDERLYKLAVKNAELAARWSAVPGASLRWSNVTGIYAMAYKALSAAATRTGNRQVAGAAVQVRLGPAEVQSAQARAQDTNPAIALPRYAVKTATDTGEAAATAADWVSGVLTGRKPAGIGEGAWWAWKWGTRAGVALLIVVGARVYFAPEYTFARDEFIAHRRRARGSP